MNKTALVLEGGGMRGVFTAGVLDFFIDKNITFDNVTGVSAGAGHAVSYLSGQRERAYRVNVDYLDDKRYCSLDSLIKTGDLFGADMLYREIPEKLDPYDYDAYLAQNSVFRAVVTDCETGRAEYPVIREMHNDIQYVRASASLPFVSKIVNIGKGKFLDGGISDPIPFEHMLDIGCNKVVTVLTQPYGYRKKRSHAYSAMTALFYPRYKGLREAICDRYLVYNDTLDALEEAEERGEVFVIRPPRALGIGRIEKDRAALEKAYRLGYRTAERSYAAMKKYLED